MKVLVVGDGKKPGVKDAVERALEWLGERAEVCGVELSRDGDLRERGAELIVSFGGDGTMLSVARRLRGERVPVVGVNLGRVGFLAELELSRSFEGLEAVLAGNYRVSERMMLVARSGGEEIVGLNDAVVCRAARPGILTVEVLVGGERAIVFLGDGVIVSTPTGSTGYCLSAGGPILSETLHALAIVPLCAHSLSARPIIVGADDVIEVVVGPEDAGPCLVVDGQVTRELAPPARIEVTRFDAPFRLVELTSASRLEIARKKLHWTGDE